jgi:hypothetical protein
MISAGLLPSARCYVKSSLSDGPLGPIVEPGDSFFETFDDCVWPSAMEVIATTYFVSTIWQQPQAECRTALVDLSQLEMDIHRCASARFAS